MTEEKKRKYVKKKKTVKAPAPRKYSPRKPKKIVLPVPTSPISRWQRIRSWIRKFDVLSFIWKQNKQENFL